MLNSLLHVRLVFVRFPRHMRSLGDNEYQPSAVTSSLPDLILVSVRLDKKEKRKRKECLRRG